MDNQPSCITTQSAHKTKRQNFDRRQTPIDKNKNLFFCIKKT